MPDSDFAPRHNRETRELQSDSQVQYRTLVYDLERPRRSIERYVEEDLDPIGNFVHSAFYAGLQAPIDGVRELTNNLVNRELLPRLNLISQPQYVERLPNMLAQKFGAAAGTIPLFLLINKGVTGVGAALGLVEAGALTLGTRTALAGASGFVYGGVFQPNAANPDSNHRFWRMRLDNAVTNAATFATITYAGGRLNQKWMPSDRPFFEKSMASDVLRNVKAGGLAGAIGGVVHAEVGSVMGGTGLASIGQLGQSISDFAIVGAGMGAVNGVVENRKYNSIAKERVMQSRSTEVTYENLDADKGAANLNVEQQTEVHLDVRDLDGKTFKSPWKLGRDAQGGLYLTTEHQGLSTAINNHEFDFAKGERVHLAPGDHVDMANSLNAKSFSVVADVSSASLAFENGGKSIGVPLGGTRPLADLLTSDKFSGLSKNLLLGRDGTGHFIQNSESNPTVFDFVTNNTQNVAPGQKSYIKPGQPIGVFHGSEYDSITVR